MHELMTYDYTNLITDKGISAPAFGFFAFILAGLGKLLRDSFVTKRKVDKAIANTTATSNGFASGVQSDLANVVAILNRLDGKYDKLDEKLDTHIELAEKIISINSLDRGGNTSEVS